jgi:hypothetical protein
MPSSRTKSTVRSGALGATAGNMANNGSDNDDESGTWEYWKAIVFPSNMIDDLVLLEIGEVPKGDYLKFSV